MKQSPRIEAPDGLEDLGLNQDQLRALQGYFALQYRFAKQQRMAILGMLIVVGGSLIMRSMQDNSMPFLTLLDLAVQWLPVAGVVMGCVSIGMAQYIQHVANKRLPELDLSATAVHRVRELAAMMTRAVIFSLRNL